MKDEEKPKPTRGAKKKQDGGAGEGGDGSGGAAGEEEGEEEEELNVDDLVTRVDIRFVWKAVVVSNVNLFDKYFYYCSRIIILREII